MSDYALSTNLYSFVQANQGYFGWPDGSGEAEIIAGLLPGDLIIPKFAQSPEYAGHDDAPQQQRAYCLETQADYDEQVALYNATIQGGENAVPFLLRVTGPEQDFVEGASGKVWRRVKVEKVPLAYPLSSQEFLRLRALPIEVAQQFKGTVASSRHLQPVPRGTADAVQKAASTEDRGDHLREYTVVEAMTADEAGGALRTAGRRLLPGDRIFIASSGSQLGVHEVRGTGELAPLGQPIAKTPTEMRELFQDAAAKAESTDSFAPSRAIAAAAELEELISGPDTLVALDDFTRFHDRYTLLSNKVTQALRIDSREFQHGSADAVDQAHDAPLEAEDVEADELATLEGLDIDQVRAALPSYMVIPDDVLREAVISLRAGKHLLLSGPPGTGKSTLAEALCRAVRGNEYSVATGTADWTTFDTIGGYMPTPDGLEFEPGIILRCLQRGQWLVIDELNRADIDKAFGPLFTLLGGSPDDGDHRGVVLPYQSDRKSIEIKWAARRTGSKGDYVLTPGWRMLGTLNISDKATLFRLSFAFLRRFAVIEVPLPPRDDYEHFFSTACAEVPEPFRSEMVQAGMALAFGDRQLGPAILHDIAEFVRTGITETASGKATYEDPVDAFVVAVRLFAVPQYEGAPAEETKRVEATLRAAWPDRGDASWTTLSEALSAITLS